MAGALGCAAATAGVFVSMPAQAACITTSLPGNNCVTYDTTGGTTTAILEYSDNNLTNNFWQINAYDPTYTNFSNWQYSVNGGAYTSFDPGLSSSSGGIQVGTVFNSQPAPTNTSPFRIKVTLSNTATLNDLYGFVLYTNGNGGVTVSPNVPAGVLANNGPTYNTFSRDFTRVNDPATAATPGPLPLMGAAAAFGYSRKIRKAIRSAG